MHVQPLDLGQGTGGGAVVGDELGDDGEGAVRVDGQAGTVKVRVAQTVGVVVAAVGVASAAVAVAAGAVSSTAGVAVAHGLADGVAWVCGEGVGDAVRFPDVHLRAAGAVVANTGVDVVARWLPAVAVGFAIDELQVAGALRVAVSGTVFGAGLVARVLRGAAVSVHGDEVQRAVETAGEVGHVHVKCELLAEELEHLIGTVITHEVQPGSDVLAGALGDEVQAQLVAGGSHTVGRLVSGTIERAVRGAGHIVGTDRGVPLVASVAVGGAGGRVHPAPIGINDHRAVISSAAATAGAGLPGQRRMRLSGVGSNLLSIGSGKNGEQQSCSVNVKGRHCDSLLELLGF